MNKSIIEQFGEIIEPIVSQSDDNPVSIEIAKWVNERIEVAKQVLQDNNKNASRELTQSIAPLPIVKDGFIFKVQVEAEDYWDFVNSGVNGTEVQRGAPYSHKGSKGEASTFLPSIRDWMRFRGITTSEYYDKKGALKIVQLDNEQKRNGMAFGIIKKIIKEGQKATPFMEIAFSDEAIDDLENRIIKIWQ